MKKTILKLSMFVLVAGTLVWTGCKSDDKTAPVITLKGNATETIVLGGTYTDASATANDDKDGDISSKITVTVTPSAFNNGSANSYMYHYNVSDAAGNAATEVMRTVNVIINPTVLAGSYNQTDVTTGTLTGTSTITTSSQTGRIVIGNFALSTSAVYADLTGTLGTTLVVPSQTFGSGPSETYYGTGTVNSAGNIITINYTDSLSTGAVQHGVGTYQKL
ncbi:MAG: immunoglobulin-like domain-containing protein [Bacteroidota bacterium]